METGKRSSLNGKANSAGKNFKKIEGGGKPKLTSYEERKLLVENAKEIEVGVKDLGDDTILIDPEKIILRDDLTLDEKRKKCGFYKISDEGIRRISLYIAEKLRTIAIGSTYSISEMFCEGIYNQLAKELKGYCFFANTIENIELYVSKEIDEIEPIITAKMINAMRRVFDNMISPLITDVINEAISGRQCWDYFKNIEIEKRLSKKHIRRLK